MAAGVPLDYVIRDGVVCCCGPLHGRFARCVGSASPFAESLGLASKRPKRVYFDRQSEDPELFNFFLIDRGTVKGRGKQPFTQADIDGCADCGHIGEARRYCEAHRALARFNVLQAALTDYTMTTMDLVMAEHGIDLTV